MLLILIVKASIYGDRCFCRAGGRLSFPMLQADTPRPAPGFLASSRGEQSTPPQKYEFVLLGTPGSQDRSSNVSEGTHLKYRLSARKGRT
jgi:hypothetical protein